MDIIEIINGLKASTVQPVYLLHGPERFFIDQVVAKLKSILLTGPMADFNLHEFKGGTVAALEIVAQARQIPMMATRSLVLVEDGHGFSAEDLRVLGDYMADPSPDTCLVVVGNRFDMRRGEFKRATQRNQVFLAEPLKERGIRPFLESRAAARGVSISQSAMAVIGAVVGPNCAALDDAVERLGLYKGPDGDGVSEDDVSEVVSVVRVHSVFELVDAIGTGQLEQALTLLGGLLSRREEPIMINAMVARHFRLLLRARIYLHQGKDQRGAAASLGVPPFVVKKLFSQARRFRGAALEKGLARLARADFELKSAKRSGALVVEAAVMDLCLAG